MSNATLLREVNGLFYFTFLTLRSASKIVLIRDDNMLKLRNRRRPVKRPLNLSS